MRKVILSIASFALCFEVGCSDKDDSKIVGPTTKSVKIEISNTSNQLIALNSGTFGTAPTVPGDSISFSFVAPKGTRLSFTAMFGKSSDWFYAPADTGISLWSSGGTALSGDITSLVSLWDAGTKLNQHIDSAKPAIPDTNTLVRPLLIPNFATDSVMIINITSTALDSVSDSFTVTFHVLPTSVTPVSPGIWAVHASGRPLFEANAMDKGRGLKAQAESGNPSGLFSWITPLLGVATPLSPILYLVTTMDTVIFDSGMAAGRGLEPLAEDGNPAPLKDSLSARGFSPIVLGTMVLLPGSQTSFTISVVEGRKLYFVAMYGQSNDVFFGTPAHGIELWPVGGNLLTGDITGRLSLWDAGTEVNQYPGYGPDQAARQAAPNTGISENEVVRPVNNANIYGQVNKLISVQAIEQ